MDGLSRNRDHGRIVTPRGESDCLDAADLDRLEKSFRQWAAASPRSDVRLARQRLLAVFLLIRYTGAKLNEVLSLNPLTDFDFKEQTIHFRNPGADHGPQLRIVQISKSLSTEIQTVLAGLRANMDRKKMLAIDPGFVRRKFYERAEACGFAKRLGGPEMLRRARAVELMQNNLPLPAVQKMLGHSTPHLTSAHVSFSAEEIQQVTKAYMEREASRQTSARNAFFGKIETIQSGDIQSCVTIITLSGYTVTTVITNESLEVLGLKPGRLLTAEVKAPLVVLHKGEEAPRCSAANQFKGIIERVNSGKVNTEFILRLNDGTTLCAIACTASSKRLSFSLGDRVWALFNSYSVVLHID
jgi:molybdate transport system regulatory protein